MAVHTPWLVQVLDAYLTGKTIKAMLVTTAYVDDPMHGFRSALVEASGTGYTAGGVTITGVGAASVSGGVGILAGDAVFGDVDLVGVAGVAFYVDTGNASADPILAVDVFSDPVDTTGSPEFTYHPDPEGIIVLMPPA